MKTTEHGIEDSKDVENIYHMRLMTLLQELVREKGYKGAARVLEIDQATVTESAKTGQLTRRVRQALERALQEGVGSAAERQRQRNEQLEERVEGVAGEVKGVAGEVETLGKETRRRLSAIEGEVAALRREGPQGTGAGHAGAGPSRGGVPTRAEGGASGQGRKPPSKPSMRREHPDLATREPAPMTTRRYSARAWPLIVEWRELKDGRPNDGKGLAWLAARERLLVVELALLEEHGMTLPPEKQPLRGLDRSGQVNWRRTALYDTRRALKKQELLRWARRVLTLGLWRR